jgi:sortase B
MKSDSTKEKTGNAVCRNGAAWLIWILDKILEKVLIVGILLAIALMAYSWWDNQNIQQAAAPETYAAYKPSGESTLSFRELKKMNPDVFGWIDIYDTTIDYPLVQGDSNQEYLSTNEEGKFSLTGAIFLDKDNSNQFTDFNSIIYGHNMVPEVMFGGIKRFKTKTYFNTHKYGDLYYNGRHHGLKIFALVETDGYDWTIYHPGVTGNTGRSKYLEHLLSKMIRYRKVSVERDDHIVLLSTCTEDKTNGRLILVAEITNQTFDNPFAAKTENKVDASLWPYILAGVLAGSLVILIIFGWYRKKKKEKEREREREGRG